MEWIGVMMLGRRLRSEAAEGRGKDRIKIARERKKD